MPWYPEGVTAMKSTAIHTPALCARFHHASELIGRRWTGAVIFLLLQQTCRFATLRDAIPDITDRMLSERLQELEKEGIVERVVVPDTPVRVEYSLTRKGRGLAEAVNSLANWAEKHVPLEAPVRKTAKKRTSGRSRAAMR